MTTLHTFGCSITQGFALPDVVKIQHNSKGEPLSNEEIVDAGISWEDIHLYKASELAWPKVLADRLGMSVNNYARRGASFQQISRQCAVAVKNIKPDDTVIVMWTYLSRLALQWPARTSVPFCNVVNPLWGWRTVIKGFNKFFGLSRSNKSTDSEDEKIQKYIEDSTKNTFLDSMGIYDRYYNSMVLQQMTDGFLKSTGARVIHLSVEPEASGRQLEEARLNLRASLKKDYTAIPHPREWYHIKVDHNSCDVILDPSIPPAENDMHPSVQHHSNFAEHIHRKYFNNQ